MNDFLKSQKRFKRIRDIFLIIGAVSVFVYIGIQPYLAKSVGNTNYIEILLFALVAASLVLLFFYESKYAPAAALCEDINYEITDCGFYVSNRNEKEPEAFLDAVLSDLASDGYRLQHNVEADGLTFDGAAFRNGEFFYAVCVDSVDKNDVVAYTDSALYDITSNKMKYKGNALVLFISDNADEGAVALSKSVMKSISGKRVLRLGIAIADLKGNRFYLRGNEPSVIQKLGIKYVLGAELPPADELKSEEKLSFQNELENKMKSFNLKDFKNGLYNER